MAWCDFSLSCRMGRCKLNATWRRVIFGRGPDRALCGIHKRWLIKRGYATEDHFYRQGKP